MESDRTAETETDLGKTAASLAKTAALNRREWPRYTAEKDFSLAASIDGRVVPCTIVDVSLGGAKLRFDEDAPDGTAIALSHPDSTPVNCIQVWRRHREVGIEFDFSEDSLGLISVCLRNMIELEPDTALPA